MEKLFTKAFAETIKENGVETKLFVASDEVEDRQGEVISVDGWQLDNFKINPVLLWGHDQYRPAIGLAEKIGFKTINGLKKLIFQPKFHRKDEFSRLVADLVDDGWIKASSVGFQPKEQEENKYTKQELLEISFVNVPANPNALSLAFAKGYSSKAIKMVMPDADLEDIKEKAVIPYKKYPLSPEGVDWDAGAEVKDAEPEDLKKICTWYDTEKPELKGSYKLPHHTLSGYKTVWRGVAAAMAALMGARGGVDIPDSDRQGVYNHLTKHYAEFDKEPPEMRSADEIVEKYAERIGAEDKVNNLIQTFNSFIEEVRADKEKRIEIAQSNTDEFKKHIEKRFEDIELNIQGLAEGINPTDKGLEQRMMDIEDNIISLSEGIRALVINSSEKGETGREPIPAVESKKDVSRRVAIKALNRFVEALNKIEKQ